MSNNDLLKALIAALSSDMDISWMEKAANQKIKYATDILGSADFNCVQISKTSLSIYDSEANTLTGVLLLADDNLIYTYSGDTFDFKNKTITPVLMSQNEFSAFKKGKAWVDADPELKELIASILKKENFNTYSFPYLEA